MVQFFCGHEIIILSRIFYNIIGVSSQPSLRLAALNLSYIYCKSPFFTISQVYRLLDLPNNQLVVVTDNI